MEGVLQMSYHRCLHGAVGALITGVVGLFASIAPCVAAAAPPIAAYAPAPIAASGAADPADWAAFRARFMTTDGRVIDNANGGITHSEGQGYGMLLAAYYGDRPSFELMLDWTEKTLRRPGDHLSAWRFDPVAKVHVADTNNATDGDLYIAWALARAGETWRQPAYTARAAAIATDILRLCVVQQNGRTLLLPGANGFRRPEGTVLNLSYYAFTALRGLAKVVQDPRWALIERDGLAVMRAAHFGPHALPPDWLLITPEGKYRPADGWPARFSYDAVRIPLNLAWAHLLEPALYASLEMWGSSAMPVRAPAWVSLDGTDAANYPIGPGVKAIMEVSAAEAKGQAPASMPSMTDANEYYQAALLLLAKLVVADPEPTSAPVAAETRMAAISSWLPISVAHAASLAETSAISVPEMAAAPPISHYAVHQLAAAAAGSTVASIANPWPDYAPFARPALRR